MKKSLKILSILFLGIFLIAIATGGIAEDDDIPPVITKFNVSPTLLNITNPTATISWTVTDEGGSHLKQVEIWRAFDANKNGNPDEEEWSQIAIPYSNGVDSHSSSYDDTPTLDGTYWYGLHVLDKAGNIGYEPDPPGPIKVTVDKTRPTGTINAIPKEVRADEIFNVIVNGEDNIDMGVVCYKGENDINWTCAACPGTATSCKYSFKRTESALGKYKYYGQIRDFVGNVSFPDPNYVVVIVETDPSVATFSVTYQATQATLNGYLIYLGGADSVEVWFEWGETTAYGNETSHVSKNTTGIFSATITGLTPETVYHFRAVTKNGVGTAFGDDMVTTELIKNGGFETGSLTGWTSVGTGDHKADTTDKHSGTYAGLIGYRDGPNDINGKSGIYQDLTIPSAATKIKLSLWYKFYTTDKCHYDFINIYLKDTSNNILKTYLKWCCQGCSGLNTYGWNQITDDLSAFAGQTVRIYFEVENRSDLRRRSWAYIDEVSIKYNPTSPPSVTTKPATGIETASAVLNGELIDMGQAGSVEVWFVWDYISHPNWQDYPNKTASILKTSVGPFSTLLGNLKSGTTYHYRAVAQNSAGTSAGDNLKFTTEYSAAGGWISPIGHEDPEGKWVDESKAYDAPYAPNYLETYASNSKAVRCSPVGSGLDGFIVFTLPYAVRSNKIRINADYLDIHINYVDIDVLREGIWIDVHQGPIANCAWQEIAFSEGMVSKARFRYNYKVSNWCYWVYEFQFYKVPDEPITPPAGNTLEATSIEENSAILHGQVTDDGRELCQIRFQYGTTAAYGIDTPWEGSWASGHTFGKLISGLENNTTYHFRVQIKNSAGIASGADKTFFTQSAASGWVSPQGFNDPTGKWEDEAFAFDDEIGTYAKSYRYPGDGVWSSYLYLTRKEIFSDKIRFWARELVEVDLVKIDVYRNGSWINVYNGTFPDYQWVEASFPTGKVSQARIQFHSRDTNRYFYYHLYEFDFWKIAEKPSVLTLTTEAAEVGLNQAKVKGKLIDLGGAHSVEVWFVWDKNYYDNWQDYAYSNAADKKIMIQAGEFEYTIFGLSSRITYHFRAVAQSAAGTSSGEDRTFTTLGECVTGATTTCISDEGCSHIIKCPAEGYWPPCPRDECVKNATSTPDCPCPAPPPGFVSREYGDCTDSCTCNISTEPGGPCEPWPANQPPQAAISCDPSECGTTNCIAYTGCPFHLINNSTDPDGQADIIKSEWDIYNWGADPDLSCSGICNFTPQTVILTPGTYTVELLVQDKAGASDTETITFYLLQEAMSGFMCSLDNLNWKTCESEEIKPSINQVVYFKDDPSLTEHSLPSQEATSIISRTWKINGNIFDSDNNPNPSTNLNLRSNIVELIITDNLGRTASKTHTIRATLPLPKWKEIPP